MGRGLIAVLGGQPVNSILLKAILLKAGLNEEIVPYALRHTSIVRGLRVGLPTRLVAALHDTSVGMIENTTQLLSSTR